MKDIEKSLINFINGKEKMISKEQIKYHTERDVNDFINSLFFVINKSIDSTNGTLHNVSIENINAILDLIKKVLINSKQVNRKVVYYKLKRLNSKLDNILLERKKVVRNISKTIRKVDRIKGAIKEVNNVLNNKSQSDYELVDYLIDIKDITQLEYILTKLPKLVNLRDKDGLPLYTKCILRYIDSIKKGKEEDVLYYNSVLTLISTTRCFGLLSKDKSNIIRIIYNEINHLSVKKKLKNKSKDKLVLLNELLEKIKKNRRTTRANVFEITTKKYNIQPYFENFIYDEATKTKLVRKEVIGTMLDRERINDYTITIDKKGSIELDDALSCTRLPNGNFLLKVSCSSILSHFPYDSLIVQTAIERTSSIYLPCRYQSKENDFKKVIPIFPYQFSAIEGSLVSGKDRLARTYIFEIDEDGEIVYENFIKSVVNCNKKTTYDEINDIIENGTSNKKLQELVNNLVDLTDILGKKYKPSILYEKMKETQDDYSELVVTRKGAENIVFQTMLLTNHRVAKFFRDNNYPCLYRVHEIDEENTQKVEKILENYKGVYDNQQCKRLHQLLTSIYPRGWYDIEGRHVGLDLDSYTHITSSLRRGSDIVVEHCLEVCYDNTPTKEELVKLKQEILEKRDIINSKKDRISWFVEDYKKVYHRG